MTVGNILVNKKRKVTLPQHKLFKVSANCCNVRVGDHVVATTTVGTDFTTGQDVEAGCNGMVEAVNRSADEHALFVWVRVSQGQRIA